MDIKAYLERINYHGPPTVSAETLRNLQVAHLFNVPFENLSIHAHEPIILDDEALFRKIVERRRGGFCYEDNGAFAALLRALGFQVAMLSAEVARSTGDFSPPFDHMALMVQLEQPWLVDVGFGDSFVDPIVFHAGGADQVNGHRYVVLAVGDEWQLQREDDKGKVALYAFQDVPHELGEYQGMCRFHQTSPESHFTRSWICSRATPDGRITVSNMRLIVTDGARRSETQLNTMGELRQSLWEFLGIELQESVDLTKLVS